MKNPTTLEVWRQALNTPAAVDAARQALALFKSYCSASLPRVPGMATGDRLAIRIHLGRTIEEAAAREYLYRWHLAILEPDQCMLPHNSTLDPCVSIFGTPHAIGL